MQNPNNACPFKEAKANDLARLIKEAKALDVKTDSKTTIIIETPGEGSNRINLTSYINLITLRKKDKIKAKKANGVELKD